MAGGEDEDKTEAPSARRLERARAEGRAPLSREATSLAVLGAAALVAMMALPPMAAGMAGRLRVLLERTAELGPIEGVRLAGSALVVGAAPFVLASLVASCAAVLGQTRLLLNWSALAPDLARLDPRRGLARLLGPTSLIEAAKGVAKLAAVGFVAWTVLGGAAPLLRAAVGWEPGLLVDRALRLALRIVLAMLAVQAVVAVLDGLHTYWKHMSGLRMSRHELREEHKEAEGDPAIKARVRRLRMARARKRMMAAVPNAAVVVTNPTHYAVALAYDRGGSAAPRVVAKGVDEAAARIREVAQAHGVPLVANPPLARALYPVELDREIPIEHYQAVAEIIAYVWRLRSGAGAVA